MVEIISFEKNKPDIDEEETVKSSDSIQTNNSIITFIFYCFFMSICCFFLSQFLSIISCYRRSTNPYHCCD